MAFFPGSQPKTAQAPQVSTTINITPSSVTNGVFGTQTFTVAGLDPIQHQIVNVGQLAQDSSAGTYGQTAGILVVFAYVSAANTLSIVFFNTTGAPASPAAGFYSLVVL